MNFSDDFLDKLLAMREAVDPFVEAIYQVVEKERDAFCREHIYLMSVIHEGV